ncbi:hypothetical protein AVEN_81356-1 [Araneus ventricosus]|uniref:Uncharacterized protein n=1 Tax=Araneus ventricosus TaxID=182803 RepID=A0A4Y2B8L8_ARAVE|nr:hypothetical protein AVEN_81356-1 [Araneus ventricosus]
MFEIVATCAVVPYAMTSAGATLSNYGNNFVCSLYNKLSLAHPTSSIAVMASGLQGRDPTKKDLRLQIIPRKKPHDVISRENGHGEFKMWSTKRAVSLKYVYAFAEEVLLLNKVLWCTEISSH